MAYQGDSQMPGLAGRNRFGKKEPDMRAVTGARNLQRRRNIQFSAGLHKGHDILAPVGLVEIGRQKIAAVIGQKRIDADSLFPGQMVVNHLIGHRQQLALTAVAAFDAGFVADAGLPLIAAGR